MALKVGRGAEAPPFIVMDVIAAANARAAAIAPGDPRVIRMEVGQPATGAPAVAVAAAIAAMRAGETLGYTEAFGIRPLRERIARLYADRYGVDVPVARIAVTVGASGAFPLAFLAGFDRGDRVALAAPFYPPYVNILTALGLEPVLLEAGPESRYQPTAAMLAALDPPPDGLIVASPCNPAGTMLHADELAVIARWCEANGVRLISDEIYHGLTYGEPAATAAAIPGAVVINSFSKYWSMTGWRVGWMVLPEDLTRPVERLAQNLFISAPGISQVAALAAFDADDELRGHVARYAANRALLLDALPKAGIDRLAPAEGAFYLYADVGHLTNDSAAWCARMLAEIAVAATPGVDFDRRRGHRTVRFSFCGTTDDMAEAAERIRRWLA
ncbi:aminotransferase class I/II-fold pyridoxal phosphate-dependent enzyme [Elioraea sp. Yellowstone]|jgi:aspartate/methionine/tyrosine aminotransferase|uniref:pyridoxal phosphate-dependent aminotransferase n=1 Tax=Elioraea sp. Yellowstone TaxID=2592070 RepID=UPI00115189DE|nr:aminotransferase class I/II-fold pyridoxal phosphate-dependent enzyme [Elioraea sp. Yellowstone]TQF76639.1 aminotransferase class I/II-fold pyridoxal phosphate-dependent enzyme [Elioraea sp. Yellowstone]